MGNLSKKLLILFSVTLNVIVLLYAIGLIRIILGIQAMLKENSSNYLQN